MSRYCNETAPGTAQGAVPWTAPVTAVALAALLLLGAAGPAIPVGAAPAPRTTGPWQWPLAPQPRVLRDFEAPRGPFAPGHRGVDLAARAGQQVRSAGPGVVAFAGLVAGRSVVSVAHPGGRRTTYEPVAAAASVGQRVAGGGLLGTVSSAPGHCLPATCLHWGLRLGDAYLDPLRLVSAATVRLLPVWGSTIRLRAGREGPRRAVGSRRGRCRRAPRAGRSRDPPRS